MLQVQTLPDSVISLFLRKAYDLARTSSDSSNQNGAVLINPETHYVRGEGANNFPNGVAFTDQRAEQRPAKYRYYEHAERWAVYDAAKKGEQVEGCHMICPWAACCDCARSLIVSGVYALYMHQQRMDMTPDRWKDDVNEALNMLSEAGVVLRYFDGPIAAQDVLVNGQHWSPMDQPVRDSGNWAIGMEG